MKLAIVALLVGIAALASAAPPYDFVGYHPHPFYYGGFYNLPYYYPPYGYPYGYEPYRYEPFPAENYFPDVEDTKHPSGTVEENVIPHAVRPEDAKPAPLYPAGPKPEPSPASYNKLKYVGPFKGSCDGAEDGLYYIDYRSFAFCSNGNKAIQNCPEASENPPEDAFKGKDTRFCSINRLKHENY